MPPGFVIVDPRTVRAPDGQIHDVLEAIEALPWTAQLCPSDAIRLAGFVRQNLHRASDDTQALAELILGDVDRALANSAIGQRVAEEMERENLGDIRRAVEGKRFLLIGGQRQDWYDALRRDLGVSGDSEWRESSRAEQPSMHQLKDVVKAGKLDGVFLFTDFMSHMTSSIKETARQHEVPCIEAKMSRQGMVEALRVWVRTAAVDT